MNFEFRFDGGKGLYADWIFGRLKNINKYPDIQTSNGYMQTNEGNDFYINSIYLENKQSTVRNFPYLAQNSPKLAQNFSKITVLGDF